MANSELSKLKILFIYDYFRQHVNAFGKDSSVSVNDLIAYLEKELGYVFERKSIYADISKINEYVSRTSVVKGSDSWITVEGRRYRKNQIKDEITIDEARLLVDAISTTTFVDTQLCDKIIKMFPNYFSGNYHKRALYPHDEKISRRSISYLNNIRTGIESKQALNFDYGYILGSELTEKSPKTVSPMALDWDNNCYYLIAVDNAEAKDLERDQALSAALRRYRLDRMVNVNVDYDGKIPYIDYKNEKLREQELRTFIEKSLSAYSGKRLIVFGLKITGENRKDVLKAYSAFASKVKDSIQIKDDTKLDKGVLEIIVRTVFAPTLYTDLFELSTFNGVEIEIDNDEVCRDYAEYIKKAARAANLKKL